MGGKEGGRDGGRVRKEKAREKEKKENLEKEKKKEKRERKESKDGNWKVHTLKQNKKQCFHHELDGCGAITTFSKKAGRYLNPILQIRHGLKSPQNSNPNLIIFSLKFSIGTTLHFWNPPLPMRKTTTMDLLAEPPDSGCDLGVRRPRFKSQSCHPLEK